MFIIESDEIDKLYLPAHSNHRLNVHKQLRCICTQCYRGVTHQGQHVVTSHIYKGGGNYSKGEGSYRGRLILYFFFCFYQSGFSKIVYDDYFICLKYLSNIFFAPSAFYSFL